MNSSVCWHLQYHQTDESSHVTFQVPTSNQGTCAFVTVKTRSKFLGRRLVACIQNMLLVHPRKMLGACFRFEVCYNTDSFRISSFKFNWDSALEFRLVRRMDCEGLDLYRQTLACVQISRPNLIICAECICSLLIHILDHLITVRIWHPTKPIYQCPTNNAKNFRTML